MKKLWRLPTKFFSKMNLLILFLLLPIIALYAFSYQTSVQVLKKQVTASRSEKLGFLLNQIETNVNQLSLVSGALLKDPQVKKLPFLNYYKDYVQVTQMLQIINDKITLQSQASSFTNTLSVFAPQSGTVIGSMSEFDSPDLTEKVKVSSGWDFRKVPFMGNYQYQFVQYFMDPVSEHGLIQDANLVVKVSFSPANIRSMLEHAEGMEGDTFFYNRNYNPILTPTTNVKVVDAITSELQQRILQEHDTFLMEFKGQKYIINYMLSNTLQWYLIDVVPLKEMLTSIESRRNIFYISIIVISLLGLLASAMLYRHIINPVNELVHNLQKLKRGDYSARIKRKSNGDFDFLNRRFNEMAEEIQQLIETVYQEKLYAKEALVKQLQSQINPHFLYNSLAFIKGMAQMDRTSAVVAMTKYLSGYYRYTTRIDQSFVTLEEEIGHIRNYLSIFNLQMRRLQFEISIPGEMEQLQVPRLSVQPIIENAIVHGLEPKEGSVELRIFGERLSEGYRVIVEDNGIGMSAEKKQDIEANLHRSSVEQSFGLWNVHQRMVHVYGKGSGLTFEQRPKGGLRVILYWHSLPRHSSSTTGSLPE